MNKYSILEWDSSFFGFKVATIHSLTLAVNEIEAMVTQMKGENIRLAYWKTPFKIEEFPTQYTVKLSDVACLYSSDILKQTEKHPNISLYNQSTTSPELESIAIQCGILSRFNTDKKFPPQAFESLYKTWINKSVSKEIADDIIIYTLEGKLGGIVTVSIKNGVGNIGLFGIDESMRGKGIGTLLLQAAITYFADNNCTRAQVVTQKDNEAARGLYEKCGLTLIEQKYCYHIWL